MASVEVVAGHRAVAAGARPRQAPLRAPCDPGSAGLRSVRLPSQKTPWVRTDPVDSTVNLLCVLDKAGQRTAFHWIPARVCAFLCIYARTCARARMFETRTPRGAMPQRAVVCCVLFAPPLVCVSSTRPHWLCTVREGCKLPQTRAFRLKIIVKWKEDRE